MNANIGLCAECVNMMLTADTFTFIILYVVLPCSTAHTKVAKNQKINAAIKRHFGNAFFSLDYST